MAEIKIQSRVGLDSFTYFSDEIDSNIEECGIFMLNNKMCHYLDDEQKPMNQYSKGSVHITKACKGKRSIPSQDRSTDFNIREHKKFTDRVSNLTLQLTFKKYEFWCSTKTRIASYLKRLLKDSPL